MAASFCWKIAAPKGFAGPRLHATRQIEESFLTSTSMQVGGGVENFLRGRQALKTYQCAEESSRSAVDVLAWAETMR